MSTSTTQNALDSLTELRHSLVTMNYQSLTRVQPDGVQTSPATNHSEVKVKYCLYARKSTESEERQVLSIDSQIKEMLELAERENLEIVAVKRESHSAKETGTRPIFNEIIEEVREGRYNGIITWAPDRISRNAGDLGKVVDLMDAGVLQEIR
ncbi:MAG: recombinase family protein, partial [bacterium]